MDAVTTTTLLGAGIALGSSLITAAVASHFESKRDAARREHADRTEEARRQHEASVRFHDDRLATYVDYTAAALRLAASAQVWEANGCVGPFRHVASADLGAYIKANARTRMLAKPALLDTVRQVHNAIERLITPDLHPPGVIEGLSEELIQAARKFETAAKAELGIA